MIPPTNHLEIIVFQQNVNCYLSIEIKGTEEVYNVDHSSHYNNIMNIYIFFIFL